MTAMEELDAVLDEYKRLVSSNEDLARQIGSLEHAIKAKIVEREKIYKDIALVEAKIRNLVSRSAHESGVEPTEDPPKEEASKPKRRRKGIIDVNKAVALRNAGWSYRQIAGEFGVSHQAVAKMFDKREEMERLTDKEKAACDQLAEELFGGKNE